MPRVPMLPLHSLRGELVEEAKAWLKQYGDGGLKKQVREYEDGKEFPIVVLSEKGEVIGIKGMDYTNSLLHLKIAFALDLGMVRVVYPRYSSVRRNFEEDDPYDDPIPALERLRNARRGRNNLVPPTQQERPPAGQGAGVEEVPGPTPPGWYVEAGATLRNRPTNIYYTTATFVPTATTEGTTTGGDTFYDTFYVRTADDTIYPIEDPEQ